MRTIDLEKSLNIRVSRELYVELARRADEDHRTLSSLVRHVLAAYVADGGK